MNSSSSVTEKINSGNKFQRLLYITIFLLFTTITVWVAISVYQKFDSEAGRDSYVPQLSERERIKIEREKIVQELRKDFDNSREHQEVGGSRGIYFNNSITFDEIRDIESDHQLRKAGWIPSWSYASGVESVSNRSNRFDYVSPVWYRIDDNGEIVPDGSNNTKTLLDLRKELGIKVVPTVASFDFNDFKASTSSQEKVDSHIDKLVSIVLENGYDGIDLDYESIELVDKAAFERIVKETSERLHQHDKLFSVTVLSKWGDNITYPSLRETRQVQDWSYIATYADQVRIMTYDYTHPSGKEPGPIAPINWMIAVLEYATTKMPREKIWLGIHLYSYEWHSDGVSKSYFHQTVNQLLTEVDEEMAYDEESQEAVAAYSCKNSEAECVLYFPTPESIDARIKIAQHFRIAGVSYWSLGKEGELLR